MGNLSGLQKIDIGGGGDHKPAVGYIAMRTQDDGFEFRGIFKNTFKKMEKDKETGEMKERITHYFTASNAGTFEKLNNKGKSSTISYQAGDEVGINGVSDVNRALAKVEPGAALVLVKTGEKKLDKGTVVLVDTYRQPEAASDDNDSF